MNFGRGAVWSWLSVTVLALLCAVLGLLQYRSVDAIAAVERDRLYQDLRSRLDRFTRALNGEIAGSGAALIPSASEIESRGRAAAYAENYRKWKQFHRPLFRRIALAIPDRDDIRLVDLNLDSGEFSAAAWPSAWAAMHDALRARLSGGRPFGPALTGLLFEVPRFGPPDESRGAGPEDWLLLELDAAWLRNVLIPETVNRFLSENGDVRYDVRIVSRADASEIIYSNFDASAQPGLTVENADAAVRLLPDAGPGSVPGRGGRGRAFGTFPGNPRVSRPPPGTPAGPPPGRRADFGRRSFPPDGFADSGRPRGPGPDFPDQGRWLMLVRNRAGSLESLVKQTKQWNLAVTGCILALILATGSMLVGSSRHAQRLADLQINFVAGVSHELRTPLTVIRTAAWNLRAPKLRNQPEQVERYGRLIEGESAKLETLVEQVLRFASAKAGHIVGEREPLRIETLLAEEAAASRAAVDAAGLVIEEKIAHGLPQVLADGTALRQALRNLLDNALKHGAQGAQWIGIYADSVVDGDGPAVQIRIADRGPGIPRDEQARLFEPFFRGKAAVHNQIHGTGLGLSLVKSVIEAHGGSIRVRSEAGAGTEFIVRLPAARVEDQNEFAHSAD